MKIFTGVLLCLAVAHSVHSQSQSQTLDFKKDVVKSIDALNITLAFDDLNEVAKELDRINAHGQSDEVLVHQSNKVKITIKSQQDKSELLSTIATGSVPFNSEDVAVPIDQEGNLIIASYVDGGGFEFRFWTSQLKEVGAYVPFETGFKQSKLGYSDNLVCFYAVDDQRRKVYKIGLTDHRGTKLAEKEYDGGNYSASDVEIIDDHVFVLFNDNSSPATKVIAFDGSASILWTRDFPDRVARYSIINDEASKTLLIITQKLITCISSVDGHTIWELSGDVLYGKTASKTFTTAYIMDGRYMALIISEYVNDKYMFNQLEVLEAQTGEKKFERTLGAFGLRPKIYGGKEGFVLAADNQIFSYYAKGPKK